MNFVYQGIPNPICVTAEGYPKASTFLTTTNGTLVKDTSQGNLCEYLFTPRQLGAAKLYVSVKTAKGVKKIDSVTFRVKRVPNPTATIAGLGDFAPGFRYSRNLKAVLVDFDYDVRFTVKRYTIVATRNGIEVFRHTNVGSNFDEATRKYVIGAKSGDKIVIDNIITIGPLNKEFTAEKIEYRVP